MNTSLKFHVENIQFLEFELNNQCQYTAAHTWCPRHRLGDSPELTLSSDIIYKTVEFFRPYNFTGTVYFSIYNEPTLDPRFHDLCRYVKSQMNCTIQMFTNGAELTVDSLCSHFDAGVDIAHLSVYNSWYQDIIGEVRRRGYGQAITTPCRMESGWLGFDDRINIYEKKENPLIDAYCYHPIQYFMVACNGNVMLCWDDWKQTVTFGNLHTDSVETILMNPRRLAIIEQLKKNRRLDPCLGCLRPSELCISEYRNRIKL